MAATAEQIQRLRRMVNELTADTYTDTDLAAYIERYPLLDELGSEPYAWDSSTTPPSQDANEDWIPTYDLNAAAADIWDEKASVVAQDFSFSADGGNYQRNQVYEQYTARAKAYRAKRSAKTFKQFAWPSEAENRNRPAWLA